MQPAGNHKDYHDYLRTFLSLQNIFHNTHCFFVTGIFIAKSWKRQEIFKSIYGWSCVRYVHLLQEHNVNFLY